MKTVCDEWVEAQRKKTTVVVNFFAKRGESTVGPFDSLDQLNMWIEMLAPENRDKWKVTRRTSITTEL
jgi:hypothetical protein